MQYRHVCMARTYVLTLSTIVLVLRSECINTYNTQKPNTRVFNTQKMENIRILRAQYASIYVELGIFVIGYLCFWPFLDILSDLLSPVSSFSILGSMTLNKNILKNLKKSLNKNIIFEPGERWYPIPTKNHENRYLCDRYLCEIGIFVIGYLCKTE